jgi:hypothetical protein
MARRESGQAAPLHSLTRLRFVFPRSAIEVCYVGSISVTKETRPPTQTTRVISPREQPGWVGHNPLRQNLNVVASPNGVNQARKPAFVTTET